MRADLVGEQKNTTAAGEDRKHDRGRGSSTSATLRLTTSRAGLLSQHVGHPRATQALITGGTGLLGSELLANLPDTLVCSRKPARTTGTANRNPSECCG